MLMAGSAVVFARVLPVSHPEPPTTVAAIVRSLGQLLKRHANLRRHALNGALVSGAIMAFWSTYALHLSHAFGYGPARAGLFGLVGVAGTLCAAFAGRQIDGGRFGPSCLAAATLLTAGFVCLWIGGANLPAFILGVLLIDAGAGLGHSANQSAAFTLDAQARGRINSIYMTSYFLGGAAFTTIGVLAYARFGWSGVCWLGAGLGAALGGLQLLAPISTRPGPPAPLVEIIPAEAA
jgi:predicted MFS family arabinose efflux permease